MTLYAINEQLQRLLETPDGAVDTETGEIFSPEAVEALNIALDEKIEGCGIFCKNCDAEIEARKKEIETLKAAIARLEKQRDRTVELVKQFGGLNADNKVFKTSKVEWKWKLNPAHVCIAPGLTAEDFADYQRIKTVVEIDKAKIKEELKKGLTIQGASLVQDEAIIYK